MTTVSKISQHKAQRDALMALSATPLVMRLVTKGSCVGAACRALQARLFQIADQTSLQMYLSQHTRERPVCV